MVRLERDPLCIYRSNLRIHLCPRPWCPEDTRVQTKFFFYKSLLFSGSSGDPRDICAAANAAFWLANVIANKFGTFDWSVMIRNTIGFYSRHFILSIKGLYSPMKGRKSSSGLAIKAGGNPEMAGNRAEVQGNGPEVAMVARFGNKFWSPGGPHVETRGWGAAKVWCSIFGK